MWRQSGGDGHIMTDHDTSGQLEQSGWGIQGGVSEFVDKRTAFQNQSSEELKFADLCWEDLDGVVAQVQTH